MKILVDADACPVKDEIERLAARRGVKVVHVCAHASMKREREGQGVQIVFVDQGPDAADEWIVAQTAPGDIVVTQDVPLATQAVKLGAAVIDIRGRELDERNMPDRSQMRDLMTALREQGEQTRGPRPFTVQDRRAFSASLGRVLDRLSHGG